MRAGTRAHVVKVGVIRVNGTPVTVTGVSIPANDFEKAASNFGRLLDTLVGKGSRS